LCWQGYRKSSRSNGKPTINSRTKDREEAVNNDLLKEQHPSMPINQDRQSRVTFGGSKKN